MPRVTVTLDDDARARLIELAGGERKIGEYVAKLVDDEYTRKTVSVESLAAEVALLDGAMFVVQRGVNILMEHVCDDVDWIERESQKYDDPGTALRQGPVKSVEHKDGRQASIWKENWRKLYGRLGSESSLYEFAQYPAGGDKITLVAELVGKNESNYTFLHVDDGSTESPVSFACDDKYADPVRRCENTFVRFDAWVEEGEGGKVLRCENVESVEDELASWPVPDNN